MLVQCASLSAWEQEVVKDGWVGGGVHRTVRWSTRHARWMWHSVSGSQVNIPASQRACFAVTYKAVSASQCALVQVFSILRVYYVHVRCEGNTSDVERGKGDDRLWNKLVPPYPPTL